MAYKEIGINKGYSDSFLTAVGCLFSIGNASGRITWGTLYEKYPFKRLYTTLLIGQSFFPLTLPLIASVKPLFALWVLCTSFCTGGNFTIFPPCTNDVFGFGVGGTVYSYLATCFSWGAFFLLFGNLFILPYAGFNNLVMIAGMVSSLNFVLLYIMNEKPKWVITSIGLSAKKSFSKPFLAELKEETEMKDVGGIDRVKSLI
jgi:OFA family oxalate/formate antiporter-like MFS transporter